MNLIRPLSLRTLAAVVAALVCCVAAADSYRVSFDDEVRREPASGRLILFFITETGPRWQGRSPIDGPFFRKPQPLASIHVRTLKPGEVATIDSKAIAFPESIDHLHGRVRVQVILDIDRTERSFRSGPGNLFSEVRDITLSREADDVVELVLSNRVEPRQLPPEADNLTWVSVRSDLLSGFHGREMFHRAGVALPNGYFDPEHAHRRWPVIYVVPGFGGRETSAANYARMLRNVPEEFAPQAVWIVLDPETPLGHHGFCDSVNNGPCGTAFIEEFIPHLESQFRLDPRAEARLLYGHSSGGWSVLWLQLNWPDVFGACWASAPDPISFDRFQFSNLYSDSSIYQYWGDNETPSYREVDFEDRDRVFMTVRQENQMEYIIAPDGSSGGQWDAWEAMFSPRDPETHLPKPLFDTHTGAIDPRVVQHWQKFDMYKLVHENWNELGPVVANKVRLFCGEHDNYYLDRAVRQFRDLVHARLGDEPTGQGYIKIVEFAAHGSLVGLYTETMNKEMAQYIASISPYEAD